MFGDYTFGSGDAMLMSTDPPSDPKHPALAYQDRSARRTSGRVGRRADVRPSSFELVNLRSNAFGRLDYPRQQTHTRIFLLGFGLRSQYCHGFNGRFDSSCPRAKQPVLALQGSRYTCSSYSLDDLLLSTLWGTRYQRTVTPTSFGETLNEGASGSSGLGSGIRRFTLPKFRRHANLLRLCKRRRQV